MQRFDEAEALYRQMLENDPGEIESVRELGLLLEEPTASMRWVADR